MSSDNTNISLRLAMCDLNELENNNLPKRNESKYVGEADEQGIENINPYDLNSCMIFEMAIRNNDVINIISKLDYIDQIKTKFPYLDEVDTLLYSPIENTLLENDTQENETLENNILTKELEDKYTSISELSLSNYKKKLNELIDFEYSNNYNSQYYKAMIKEGIDIFDITKDIDLEIIEKYQFKDLTKKTFLDKNSLTGGKLRIIFNYLQDKLKYDFFIYPNQYYNGLEETYNEKVISKEFISNDIFNSQTTRNEINKTLIEFRKLKPTEMNIIADYLFIYDYFKASVKNNKNLKRNQKSLIYKEIQYELTRYNDINIVDKHKTKKTLSYDACKSLCESNINYSNDKTIKFYIGERTIKDRLKLMKNFIDNTNYKYIIFS